MWKQWRSPSFNAGAKGERMVEEREEAGASELHLLLSNHSSDPRIQLLENTAKNTVPHWQYSSQKIQFHDYIVNYPTR